MPDGSTDIRKAKVAKVVASAVQIVVGVANDRRMTFSTGFEGDEPDNEVNERFDRIFRLADRQKARYEIEEIEADLSKTRETLSQYWEDLARIEADYVRQQAARQVEIDERESARPDERKKFQAEIDGAILKMQQRRQEVWNEGVGLHAARGRTGAYKPDGTRATNLARIDKGIEDALESRAKALEDFDRTYDESIEALRAEIAKAEAEREQSIGNIGISVKRFEDAVVEREARLEKCKRQAGVG